MSEKAKKINLVIDLILLLVFLAGSIYFVVEAIVGELIPLKYIEIAVAILAVIFVMILLSFLVKHIAMFVIRKIVLVLLCIALLFGAIFQGKIRSAFLNVDDATESIRRMYIIVLEDSSYEKIDDLETIGFVNVLNDEDSDYNRLITHCLSELEDEDIDEIPYDTLTDGLSALDTLKIDSFLISDIEHTIQLENEENNYSEKYRVLDTIEMKITNENIQVDADLTKPFVVYISGMDDIGMPNYNGRSDVNMLAFVDPQNHHVELVSINRDAYVLNENVYDCPDKLTHLGWFGAEASAHALERTFDIKVDYTVRVTFESLIKIIDSIGGIDVDVKLTFTEQNEYRSFASDDLIHLEKGYQHLNGSQALAYARHRKTAGWGVEGREQAQRDIVKAVVEKLLSVEGALKVGDMLEVAASYVSTNLPMSSAKAFVMKAIEDGCSWSFGSSNVDNSHEYLLPVAMISFDVYAMLITEEEINQVHNLYINNKKEVHLNEFEFDLTNMEQYEEKPELEERIVTYDNYHTVIPRYFPSYYRTIY
ncbi:MAG: LCP family protein [Traorella sp.]